MRLLYEFSASRKKQMNIHYKKEPYLNTKI